MASEERLGAGHQLAHAQTKSAGDLQQHPGRGRLVPVFDLGQVALGDAGFLGQILAVDALLGAQQGDGPSEAAAYFTRERMEREAPLDAAALRSIEAADVLVVPGSYDHVEQVLSALGMPYTLVAAGQLPSLRLRPEQLVVINCPGHLSPLSIRPLRAFLEAGGSLFTTDWALKLLEDLTPGMVRYNQHPTADDVVRIQMSAHDNLFLRGVIDPGDEPVWWLEGSSYPITVLDP